MNSPSNPATSVIAVLVLWTLVFADAGAAQVPVDPAHPGCRDSAGEVFCSVQPALDAAQPGDVVTVAAGTYELWEETLLLRKDVTLRGAGPGRTVLDGGGAHSGPVLELSEDAEEVVIQGLSIINRIRQGSSSQRAAGIDHRGQALTLEQVEIRDTQGGWGGALSSGAPLAEVVLRQVSFTGNSALTGAAVDFRNAPGARLAIHDSRFSGNSAVFTGGGLFIRDAGEIELVRVRLEDNQCGNRGGAVFIAMDAESGVLSLVDSVVQGNWSKGTGGIAATGSTLSITLQGVTLANNRSANEPQHRDCSSEFPGVFRSLGGNRFANMDGCPMKDAGPGDVRD